jgi:hypothetical protein
MAKIKHIKNIWEWTLPALFATIIIPIRNCTYIRIGK